MTTMQKVLDPQVLSDMVSAKLPNAVAFDGITKVNRELTGRPGTTLTIPQWGYIGAAADLAEGATGTVQDLSYTEEDYTVKKAVKNVQLTDEVMLSAYGEPIDETVRQITMAIADKIDSDKMALLDALTASTSGVQWYTSENAYDAKTIYNDLVEAQDLFKTDETNEIINTYVIVPNDMKSVIRLAPEYVAENSDGTPFKNGAIGKIAGMYIIPTNKLNGKKKVFLCKGDAITAFMKRDVSLETERNVLNKTTIFSSDCHYVAAIEDLRKVVIVAFE